LSKKSNVSHVEEAHIVNHLQSELLV